MSNYFPKIPWLLSSDPSNKINGMKSFLRRVGRPDKATPSRTACVQEPGGWRSRSRAGRWGHTLLARRPKGTTTRPSHKGEWPARHWHLSSVLGPLLQALLQESPHRWSCWIRFLSLNLSRLLKIAWSSGEAVVHLFVPRNGGWREGQGLANK